MKLLTITTIVAALQVQGCSNDDKDKRSGGGEAKVEESSEDATEVAAPVKDLGLKKDIKGVQVRDFESTYNTFEALTGVNGRVARTDGNRTIRAYFVTELSSALPTDSNPETYSSAAFVSVIKLAGEFCSAAWNMRQQEFQSNLFDAERMANLESQELSDDVITTVSQSIAKGILRYSDADMTGRQDEMTQLVQLGKDIRDLQVEGGSNANQVKEGISVAMCSASLASINTVIK